jgi:hypothetical protein
MSGRRTPFTGKVAKNIVDDFMGRLIRYQFSGVEQHPMDVSMDLNFTVYSMDTPCDTYLLDFPHTEDNIDHCQTQSLDLPPILATIAKDSHQETPVKVRRLACRIPAAMSTKGNISHIKAHTHDIETWRLRSLKWHLVTFEKISQPGISHLKLDGFKTPHVFEKHITQFRVHIQSMPIPTSHTKAKLFPFDNLSVKVKDAPGKCYAQAILRQSVPLIRFDANEMLCFQKALAEKAQTKPINIKVTLVYDRMNMPLFSSLSQDKQGQMVCIPKSNLIGKNHPAWDKLGGHYSLLSKNEGTSKPTLFYLVFGLRMDTQQPVRAVVPISALEETAR